MAELLSHVNGVTCVVAVIVFSLVIYGALTFISPKEPPDKHWG